MRVMLLIQALVPGGAQRQLVALANGLVRRGHAVTVVVLRGGGAYEPQITDTDIRLIDLRKRGRWTIVGPLLRLRRAIRDERPDVIYSFLPAQNALAALLKPAGSAARLVFGVRAADARAEHYNMRSALAYRLEAMLSRRAALIISNSAAGRDDAVRRGMPANRFRVIANGIDVEANRPDNTARHRWRAHWSIPDDAFVVGMVARLDVMKDHGTFLSAAAQFAQRDGQARFVCVGDGPVAMREALRAKARQLGLSDCVIWAHDLPDARGIANAFDVATLSSAFGEGFPNVVGEAMACGVPVVATGRGDVAQIVGELGEVVIPGDASGLCAGWLRMRERLRAEPDLGNRVRDSIVTRFSVDTMVVRTESCLQDIVER